MTSSFCVHFSHSQILSLEDIQIILKRDHCYIFPLSTSNAAVKLQTAQATWMNSPSLRTTSAHDLMCVSRWSEIRSMHPLLMYFVFYCQENLKCSNDDMETSVATLSPNPSSHLVLSSYRIWPSGHLFIFS